MAQDDRSWPLGDGIMYSMNRGTPLTRELLAELSAINPPPENPFLHIVDPNETQKGETGRP